MIITGIAVNNRRGDASDLREFDIDEDVFFIQLEKKIPVFYTKYGPYYQLTTMETLHLWLKDRGYDKLDSVNLVKMDKIVEIDSVSRTAIFEDGSRASISRQMLEKLKKHASLSEKIRTAY